MQNNVRKNTYFVSIGQITKMAFAFLLFPFATRYLGSDGMANYALASTIMYFIFLFNDLGMNTFLTREVSKDLAQANEFYSNALTTKLILIFVDCLLLFIFLVVLQFSMEANICIIIFAVYGILTSVFELNAGIFRAHERMEFETLFVVLEKVVTTLVGIYVLVNGWGLYAFCSVFVVGGVISLIVSTVLAGKNFVKLKFSFNFKFIKKLVYESLPFGTSLFLANIYYSMGIILITKMEPAMVAGWYSTPAKLLKFINIIPTILAIAIFPALSRERVYSKYKFKQLYTKGFKYISFLAIPLIFGTALLADKIALTVFGKEYGESIIVLQILAVPAGLIFFNILLAALFNAANKQKILVVFQVGALILNTIINLILIPKYAHIGTAIAALVTEGVIFIVCFIYSMVNIAKLKELWFIPKAMAATIIMSIFLIYFPNLNLFAAVPVAAGLYFLILYALRGFRLEDIMFLKNN